MALEGITSNSVLGYVRVSSEEQSKGWSLGTQEQSIRAFCEAENLSLVQVFSDPGKSGHSVGNRPGLLACIEMVQQGGFGAVIVWREDRLGRRIIDNQDIAATVHRTGAEVITLNPFNRDRGPGFRTSGADLGQLQQILAEYEWTTIRERILPNLVKAVASGIRGGHTPFGYRRIGKGEYIPDPKTAPIVAEIFRAYRDGATVAVITAEMLGRKIISPTGKPLSVYQVAHLLENPYYLGKLHWRVPTDMQAELGSEIVIRNHHSALIDPVLYDDVQRLRRQRRGGNPALPSKRATRSQRSRRHVPLEKVLEQRQEPARKVHGALPPGLSTCGHCGGRMYARLQTRGARGKRYRAPIYECEQHKSLGRAVCPQRPVLVEEIDREVEKRLLKAVRKGRWREESPGRLPVDTRDLDVRLADREQRRERLEASLSKAGENVKGQLQERLDAMVAEIADLDGQRRRRMGEHRQAMGPRWDLLRDPALWETFDLATRRQVLQDLLVKSVIHERQLVEFELAPPTTSDGETAA